MNNGDLVLVSLEGHHGPAVRRGRDKGEPRLLGIILDSIVHPQAEIKFYKVLVNGQCVWRRADCVVPAMEV